MNDFMLHTIVSSANARTERTAPGEGVHLTLFVRGHIITGEVIPNWQMYEDMGSTEPGEGIFRVAAQDMRQAETRFAELLRQEERSEEDEKSLAEHVPHFINLRNAHWLAPGTGPGIAPRGEGVNLRVSMDSVDAFTMGSLSVEEGTQEN